jgi:DNA-binding LytR/AlgR family response regulator
MSPQKIGAAGRGVSIPEDASHSFADRMPEQSYAPLVIAQDGEEQTSRSMETFPVLPALAKQQSLRAAVKVSGKILFIHLRDVVSVHAEGKCVWLQQIASSFLLRESISVVAETLERHGFIRIHRSVLVNTSSVEEIKPLSTGEYRLRVADGKEYTVTRTYKKNLKSLAELWIGTGALFPR